MFQSSPPANPNAYTPAFVDADPTLDAHANGHCYALRPHDYINSRNRCYNERYSFEPDHKPASLVQESGACQLAQEEGYGD